MEINELRLEVQDLNQQGTTLLKAGNVEAAKEKFEQAIDIDPMYMGSYKNMGTLYLLMNEYKEAKNFLKKALLIEKNGEVYFQYGNACFMNDEPHEGLEYYNLALSAGFDSDEMFFFMGMAYQHMNDEKMALRYVQKAIAKNPSRADYKVKKIELLIQMFELEEAEKAVDELLLSDPELYDGYHMKTTLLHQQKKFDKAAEFAKTAVDRFPEDADLYLDYARSVALTENYEKAKKLLIHAEQLKYYEDAKLEFLVLQAEVEAELGNMDSAIHVCEKCIALESEDQFNESVRFMIMNLYILQEKYEEALKYAKEVVDKNNIGSVYFAALYYRAFCLKKLEKAEEATIAYKEAIKLYRLATLKNPNAFDAYLYRIMSLRDIAEYEEALNLLDFMENLNGDIAEIYTIRADIYKLTNQSALANEELKKAFKLKPELKEVFNVEEK